MVKPCEIRIEQEGGRATDGERRRLRRFWLHVIALAVRDQDADWIGGPVSGRDLSSRPRASSPGTGIA